MTVPRRLGNSTRVFAVALVLVTFSATAATSISQASVAPVATYKSACYYNTGGGRITTRVNVSCSKAVSVLVAWYHQHSQPRRWHCQGGWTTSGECSNSRKDAFFKWQHGLTKATKAKLSIRFARESAVDSIPDLKRWYGERFGRDVAAAIVSRCKRLSRREVHCLASLYVHYDEEVACDDDGENCEVISPERWERNDYWIAMTLRRDISYKLIPAGSTDVPPSEVPQG